MLPWDWPGAETILWGQDLIPVGQLCAGTAGMSLQDSSVQEQQECPYTRSKRKSWDAPGSEQVLRGEVCAETVIHPAGAWGGKSSSVQPEHHPAQV